MTPFTNTTLSADTAEPTEANSDSTLQSAIVRVMTEIKRLEKADENKFGHYRFTSIDDFKDAIRPVMAKHGLTLGMNEINFDMSQEREAQTDKGSKKTIMFAVQFEFVLRHVSGEADYPERISVTIPYVGAQSTGIARSYALKEWLKTKFLASSGDLDDADVSRQDTHTLPKREAKEVYAKLQSSLREQPAKRGALLAWASENRNDIASLPETWRETLRTEYQERLEMSPKESKSEPLPSKKDALNLLLDNAMIEDWKERLKVADLASQHELFEHEIDPARGAGKVSPAQYNELLVLLKDA